MAGQPPVYTTPHTPHVVVRGSFVVVYVTSANIWTMVTPTRPVHCLLIEVGCVGSMRRIVLTSAVNTHRQSHASSIGKRPTQMIITIDLVATLAVGNTCRPQPWCQPHSRALQRAAVASRWEAPWTTSSPSIKAANMAYWSDQATNVRWSITIVDAD